MRKMIFIAAVALCLGNSPAHALLISSTDSWQYTNISSASSSTIHADSNVLNMFGYTSNNTEPQNTIFNDTSAQGYWHEVQWTMNAPVTIESFNLVAGHDYTQWPDYRDQNYRGMSAFKLEYLDTLDQWQTLYQLDNIGTTALYGDNQLHPVYGGGVNYTPVQYLELYADVSSTTALTWRASFEQYGVPNGHASGPRILELDGYTYDWTNDTSVVPEPASLLLLGSGLAGLLWRKRRG